MSDYGAHCERLAGEGVHSGELRDYESFQEQEPKPQTNKPRIEMKIKRQFLLVIDGQPDVRILAKDHHCAARQVRKHFWPKDQPNFHFTLSPIPTENVACPQTEASTTAETSTDKELSQVESATQWFDELERRNPTGE